MANGVDLIKIEVVSQISGQVSLNVDISIEAENEFNAIGWLAETLGKEQ